MKKIAYNLAAAPRVNIRVFASRLVILVLSALLLNAAAFFNLRQQLRQNRAEGSETRRIGPRLAEMNKQSSFQASEILAAKRTWNRELSRTNSLIRHKSFSFVERFDFLEAQFGPGIQVRHITLENHATGRVAMTITAQTLKSLLALYKKLAHYQLVINNENQNAENYQVSLSFSIPHA